MKNILSLTYLLLLFTSLSAFCQTITPSLLAATGSFETTSGYSVSYTVGELAVTTLNKNSYFLTQGFQQVHKTDSAPVTPPDSIQVITVNPNPVSKYMNINFYITDAYDFWVEIYNVKGSRILQLRYSEIYYGERKSINLDYLTKGLYLVHIYSPNGKVSEMFKIEKN